MFDEVFHNISFPDNLLVVLKDQFIQLALWNESVALFISHSINHVTYSTDVWVMDDCSGGVKGSCSWIKKLTVTPPMDLAFPLAFLKNDELLMQATAREFRFVVYKLHSQMHTNIPFIEDINPHWGFSYMKSLLSVQGGTNIVHKVT